LTPSVRQIRRTPVKPVLNIFPSSSAPTTPGTVFTNNTPNLSRDIVAGQQQQQQQTLGSQYNLLSSEDKAKFLFG